MALKRPTPKTLSPEAQAAIISASAQQTAQSSRIRSYDMNYPVFEVPVNSKVLAYIPNHVVIQPDGSTQLRMDKFAAHPVIDGRTFSDIRCSEGIIIDELNLDGSCPLCSALTEEWQLYGYEYADIAKSKGISTDAAEAKEALKQDRKDLIQKFPIKQKEVWYVFPIIVIECEEKDGVATTTPKKNAEGQIVGHPMWYQIRENTYLDKWISGFDSIDSAEGEVPTTPAGLWAVLNFTYVDKNGNYDKMGSARNLKVTFKTMNGYEEWASYYDQLTIDWTPAKAQEVLALDAVLDMQEMNEAADTLMKSTRDRLALYSLSPARGVAGALPNGGTTNADNVLSEFGGIPVNQNGEGAKPATPATPQAPQTPQPASPGNLTGEMPSSAGVE